MIRKVNKGLEQYRITAGPLPSSRADGLNGAFMIPRRGITLGVIISDGLGWDHVSVSLPDRCPTWEEMCYIKNLFFQSHETVIQYHPPQRQYVNNHKYCLHLWRPQQGKIPMPPMECV